MTLTLDQLRQRLYAAGFADTTYPDDDSGVYVSKTLLVNDMPYAREHIADDKLVSRTDTAIVELTPWGEVRMQVLNTDYVEMGEPALTEEGLGLLKDAGLVL